MKTAKTKIKWLTGVGLIMIVLLQMIWSLSTFHMVKNDIKEKCNALLYKAAEREMFSRLTNIINTLPNGTQLGIGDIAETGEVSSEIPIYNEAFLKYNSPLSLRDIDSIYSHLLNEANIHTHTIFNIVTPDDRIIESTHEGNRPFWGVIKTNKVPIRIDKSQNIQAIIINPYWAIFERLWMLIVATALMMIFVTYCIAYQIKIIVEQRKIAEIKDTFSNAMIHDMKTPIAGLQMGIHILQQLKLENDVKEFLQRMDNETDQLYSLANKVLIIAKLEQGNIEMMKHEIPLKPMINDQIEKFRTRTNKPITFTATYDTETIYADEEYLKEVIANLIDNAIKYSKETVQIEVRCNEMNGYTMIKIKDYGLGISSKDQERIFEKFKRTRASLKRQHKGGASGFGLGLNYVKRVVEAHKGVIDVTSMENAYSEFIISIPKLTTRV